MKQFVVFESGSRAGLSAERFFMDYLRRHPQCDDVLLMADADPMFPTIASPHPAVRHISDAEAMRAVESEGAYIFPADELTRQRHAFALTGERARWAQVEPWYYDKQAMNLWLAERAVGTRIRVPQTFDLTSVCLRPNRLSAGTRGVSCHEDLCVTRRIDISREFVVDVLRTDDAIAVYPRQVTIKNGYDRYVRFVSEHGELARAVVEFVQAVCPDNTGIYSGIFHLQLALDTAGELYYIESSKRISGTAMVNLSRGMNPFDIIGGEQPRLMPPAAGYDKFYRYEDLVDIKH